MADYEIEATDRISKWFSRAEDNKAGKFYVHLFYEDIDKILPYQTRQNLRYTISITPKNEDGYILLANLFHKPSAVFSLAAREDDFIYSIEHFIRRAAANLAYFGQIYWEIVTLKLKVADKTISLRCLDSIPGQVIKHDTFYRQLIPRSEGQSSDSYIDIPMAKVWLLDLPEQLGGPVKQRKIIQELADLSDILPSFASSDLNRGSGISREFDPRKYSHDRFAAMTKLMRSWGWMTWQWEEKETTQYYWVYQRLQFFSSLTLIREEIVGHMNELLKRLDIPYKIGIQGLPSVNEINDYRERLKQGQVTFSEALDFVRGT